MKKTDRTTSGIEHRTVTAEMRMTDPKNEGSIAAIEGHAAIFDTRSELLGGFFFEVIAPGAFDDVLDDDVRALVDHETGKILGRKSAGTLEFGVDERGLWYKVDIPDTSHGRDLVVSMNRGDIRESSFGFSVARDGDKWDLDEEGREIRTVTRVSRLYDVSPVAFPAYADTDVALRSLQRSHEEHQTGLGKSGGHLTRALKEMVAAKVDDQNKRADVIAEMAEAASVESDLVEQVLRGESAPTTEMVDAFSEVLDVESKDLLQAAESDGLEIKSEKDRELRGRVIVLEAANRNLDKQCRELRQLYEDLKASHSETRDITERVKRRFGAFRQLWLPILENVKTK